MGGGYSREMEKVGEAMFYFKVTKWVGIRNEGRGSRREHLYHRHRTTSMIYAQVLHTNNNALVHINNLVFSVSCVPATQRVAC